MVIVLSYLILVSHITWNILDHYIATAATNGHVCLWNLSKMGKAMQEQVYQDHTRTVNKVNFHVSEPNKLISGSQDGTVRYFDIRVKNAVSVFYRWESSLTDLIQIFIKIVDSLKMFKFLQHKG